LTQLIGANAVLSVDHKWSTTDLVAFGDDGTGNPFCLALTATTVLWAIAIAGVVRALRGDPPDVQWRDLGLAIVISLLAWRTASHRCAAPSIGQTPTRWPSSVATLS
jgi:hypothetical protein